VRRLPLSDMELKLVRSPISVGMGPERSLSLSATIVNRRLARPITLGMVPVSKFFTQFKSNQCVSLQFRLGLFLQA
jgi:hypothetical protein